MFGDVPRPAQAEDLYEILDSFTEKFESERRRIDARRAAREQRKAAGVRSPVLSRWSQGSPRGVLPLTPGPREPTGRPLSAHSWEVPAGPGGLAVPVEASLPPGMELRNPDA